MKIAFRFLILAGSLIFTLQNTNAQDHEICGTDLQMRLYYEQNPEAYQKAMEFEEITKKYTLEKRTKTTTKYIFPVVFHVFGTNFAGETVTYAKLKTALQKTNEDFQGLNDDYESVDNDFYGIREKLNIEFVLAEIDPDGNSTSGVKFYENEKGFGNGSGYDSQIQQYAWDNYRYMNVYIMLDLYDDNVLNESGVAWYPDTWMSDNNLARVVYNGRYIYGNTDKEFASVLTHEFGHWLNLIHTFEGGCSNPNDFVSDTPPCMVKQGCTDELNCEDDEINGENYMDYNTTCYKMFTAGQVARMESAMNHAARKTIWSDTNLVNIIPSYLATDITDNNNNNNNNNELTIFPSPNDGKKISLKYVSNYLGNIDVNIFNTSGQKVLQRKFNKQTKEIIEEFTTNLPKGSYTIQVSSNLIIESIKMIVN